MRLWSNVRGFCATIWSSRMSSTAASNRRLEGKVAIVTASTDGGLNTISLLTIRSEERQLDDSYIRRQRIGFGIARQLVRDGAKVMISSRKQDRVSSAVSELENEERGCEVKGVVCHVAKPQHRKNLIEETLQHFGGIDILVSNAAVNPTFGPLLQTPEEAWDKIFDVNVKSAFLLAKDVIPLMEKRGGGSVVFISSIAGYQPMQCIALRMGKLSVKPLRKDNFQRGSSVPCEHRENIGRIGPVELEPL
ncbi:unnamed protein product [Porites evermanni]|uniref:Dehydrogenase/reductase SDR family member 4 n=1 Tax=Porites evermanni TaxID=104178 RepID=A0ABN8Q2X4_9CNID|nr:unnamed protein product [Porites evermanni]